MLPAMSTATPRPAQGHQAGRVVFILAVFLLWFAQYVFLPTLPQFLQDRTPNLGEVGLILAMYGLWQTAVRLPLGLLIDLLGGRRWFVIGGYLLSAAGTLLLGFGGSTGALLVGRSLTGLAMGTWVPLVVVFSGFYPPAEAVRASSLLTLITALGRITATSLAGPLGQGGGYMLPFLVSCAAAFSGALLLLLPSTIPRVDRSPVSPKAGALFGLLKRRDVLLPSLLGAVNQYAVFGISLGFLPLLARQLGAAEMTAGLLATTYLAVFTAGTLLAASRSLRLPRSELLLFVTYLAFALGVGTCAAARSLPLLFVAQGFMGLAQGIGYPTLMGLSIRQVAPEGRTTAMGVHQSVYALGIFVGPWASGVLADAVGLRPMFAATAAACLALGCAGTTLLLRGSRTLSMA
jgi:predicted MFS family arabinose efflux permease